MTYLIKWLAGFFTPVRDQEIDSAHLAFALKASGYKPTFQACTYPRLPSKTA